MINRLGDHCGRRLAELAVGDDRIRVLDGDLADSDGAVHFARAHPHRFYMAGIAEQALVSVAAGMASCGLRPFVFSFSAFLCFRAYDQIRVGLSQARQPVTLVGSHSGGCSGRNGKTHAAMNDITLMASLPNLQVWAPGSPADVNMAVERALTHSDPMYIRLPRAIMDELSGIPAECRWVGEPGTVALLATGFGTKLALSAAEVLRQAGIEAGVLHCPCIVPLPLEVIRSMTVDVTHSFVVEDHYSSGGLAAILRDSLPDLNVRPIGWPLDWCGESGADAELLSGHGLDGAGIARTVLASLYRTK